MRRIWKFIHNSNYLSILSDLPHLLNVLAEFCYLQVTLAHLIAHPGEELAKKIGVPDAGAIGIMTLTPGETAMIAGDLALKAADVHIGFLDRFSGALVIYGSVGAVEEALSQTVSGLGRLLNYTLCEMTKS